MPVADEIARALRALDVEDLKRTYQDQNEFIYLERWLPPALVGRMVAEVERARPAIHRNYWSIGRRRSWRSTARRPSSSSSARSRDGR